MSDNPTEPKTEVREVRTIAFTDLLPEQKQEIQRWLTDDRIKQVLDGRLNDLKWESPEGITRFIIGGRNLTLLLLERLVESTNAKESLVKVLDLPPTTPWSSIITRADYAMRRALGPRNP